MGAVESGPQGVLLDIAIYTLAFVHVEYMMTGHLLARVCGHGPIHGSNAADQAHTKHEPWVCAHEPKGPSVHMQCPCGNANNTNSESSVHESVVEVFALEWWHAAVLASLPVENEVDA